MFLLISILFLLLAYFFLTLVISIYQIKSTWQEANLSNNIFYNKYAEALTNTYIGCSFAPEMWNKEECEKDIPLEALKIIVEELDIKDIRLGIRWSEGNKHEDEINLEFYKPYLDYCFTKNINICLNIGPIKTFRWPEEHIPYHILQESPIKSRSTIKLDSSITKYSSKYLNNLLEGLRKIYSQKDLQKIKIIQIENEAFNRMGIFKLKFHPEYLQKLILKAKETFPHAKMLINSPGRFNLRAIDHLFRQLKKQEIFDDHDFIIGYDYYYRTQFRDRFLLSKLIDSINFSLPWDLSLKNLHITAKKHLFDLEVTEAQFEPWGDYLFPGKSIKDLKFVLLRSMKILNTTYQDRKIIRLWGIENFTKKIMNSEIGFDMKEIINMIRKVNSKTTL